MRKEVSQKNEQMIDLLLAEKGKLCVSIILPIPVLQADQQSFQNTILKAIEEAVSLIIKKRSADAKNLINSLTTTLPIIYFNKNHRGLGIYVSENVFFFTTFPFTVIRKVNVAERFELNELICKNQYYFPYLVLHMDVGSFQLYSGLEKQLEEVFIDNISPESENDFEPTLSPSTSSLVNTNYKDYEKNKPLNSNFHLENFISGVDEVLNTYIHKTEVIILFGLKKITSAFLNRTQHINKIKSVVNGSFEWFNNYDTNTLAWNSIEMYVEKKAADEISEYEEKIGEGLTEEGLYPIKQAVTDGRGDKLLIEKNFSHRATFKVKNIDNFYYTKEPLSAQTDIVNEIIDLILRDKGKVIFVERGMLHNYQGIALITSD
jgi:hypothetical protein